MLAIHVVMNIKKVHIVDFFLGSKLVPDIYVDGSVEEGVAQLQSAKYTTLNIKKTSNTSKL